ncbi:MAG: fibronectin type III domain-containing protein, partial [Gammaproteobacteria bacterium]|nr:fibronectin type III domain-containing protein [Gammaproteobacteria bacterium]
MTRILPLLLTGFAFANGWQGAWAAAAGSVEFFVNPANDASGDSYDYGEQQSIPPQFGNGEFTLEIWIRPNNAFPIGPVSGGAGERENWAIEDVQPYSSSGWWFEGNFLLDGHNNNNFSQGTFSLQLYGGGRIRWLFGDGSSSIPSGGLWSVGAYPAANSPTLLDGSWHHVTLVRRWTGQSGAQLELWVDGQLVDTETSNVRVDMRQWWNTWPNFQESGWYWGAEKQAARGFKAQNEDYKGLVDELRFWARAKSATEIATNFRDPVAGTEVGLVGHFAFGEAQGTAACDTLAPAQCIVLRNSYPGMWSPVNAPLATGGDTSPPTVPSSLQVTGVSSSQVDLMWVASVDNVGVTGYRLRRNGLVVATVVGTTYADSGVAPSTAYTYSVAALDAAGNVSAESAPVTVNTLASADTDPPTIPGNLAGTALSTSRISLTWSPSVDNVAVAGYEIRRDGTLVTTVTGTSYTDTGLTPNTGYTYTVAASDSAGNVSAES